MITDSEVWACAYELIKMHGDGASDYVAAYADRMLDRGDLERQAIWLRILEAVERLISETPGDAGNLSVSQLGLFESEESAIENFCS